MKILVDRLEATPTSFQFEGDAAWWGGNLPAQGDLPRELTEPCRFAVTAYTLGEDVLLEGTGEGGFELECSRCLARYRHPLRETFRLVLEPAGARLPADPEGRETLTRTGVVMGDELESGWFRGSEIHLDSFFRELLTGALPLQPLCREECAGLCPKCGSDRNVAPCSCSATASQSPFAVLAALRK